MELEKYLKQIKNCSNSKLPFEYGVYPGFPILLKTTKKEVFNFLE